MSIKNLFDNKGTPKIQKTVSSNEMVETVESKHYVDAKKQEFEQFVPPINFATASNFAKFGSAELYYEKSFERIHQHYPYDGTLAEKTEFHNSASYLDKHVFDNLYPRTNGYVNFDGSSQYITVFGGPHTASNGMTDKTLDSTFENSMLYNESDRRTSALEYRVDRGATVEFWLKRASSVSSKETVFDIWNGETSGSAHYGRLKVEINTSDAITVTMESGSNAFPDVTVIPSAVDGAWNHYAITFASSSSGTTVKSFKNSQYVGTTVQIGIGDILPQSSGINATIGALRTGTLGNQKFSGSIDEFRYWKTERTPEAIFNTWFIPVGGGSNKHDSNIDLGLYFKFNEGITTTDSIDRIALDYSGRINNGIIVGYDSSFRNTGSAITEKLSEPEFLDPIVYSTHPSVVAKKAEYKTSGSLADLENASLFYSYLPGWMQEEDEVNGKQLKYLCQVMGSYFDTLWHQISFLNKIRDNQYISGSNKTLPFAKELLYDRGFVMPDLFVDATITENLLKRDDNEVFEKQINEVRNTIYHNLYSNLEGIYKSKGTEKAFRNFFRSMGIGQDVVKLRMYADDSTFVLRNNYEHKSYERKYLNFNYEGHFDATLYQTSSTSYANNYLIGDTNYSGSFTYETEIVLPRKNRSNEVGYLPFTSLTASVMGFHKRGTDYTFYSPDRDLSVYVLKENLDTSLSPDDSHRIKFMVTGAFGELTSSIYSYQYENNKWNLAVRLRHENYPYGNVTGNVAANYVVELYGVEADGDTKRNSFLVSSSIPAGYFSDDKIFYAGAHRTNFTGSSLYNTDIKLGLVRYWHSYLSNDAIDQHAYDSETFGANEPFENDLVNTYPNEVPREKTLAFHWAFNNLTTADGSGELLVSDLSSGSVNSNYGVLSNTFERYIQGKAVGFNSNATNALDKMYLHIARKRLPDDLMSSDLTTIKSDETEQFFVDDDVSDNFYSFEKSLYGTISDEMMNMFSTALDLNNLIGQPNQKYHHRYNMADFLRDRFYEDVENEPDIEKFTSFYKWIDDSISIALQQLTPASARFSEKINNIVESHVLERNKYVHQIPILTTFQSTEGSIRGISEMKYDWKHGHAPFFPNEEQTNALWQKERKEKEGLREILRLNKGNHSIQSSGLMRREVGGSTRVGDAYAMRKFSRLYDVSMVSQPAIHGGVNFERHKNSQLFNEAVAPAGALGTTSGTPQNIITVGVGDSDGISRQARNDDNLPRKQKFNSFALIGKLEGSEYGHSVNANMILPLNLMSGNVHTGYGIEVKTNFSSDVVVSNLHHDSAGNYNERSMQGPFTEAHVGGLQYRHIDINKHDAAKSVSVFSINGGTFPSASIQFTTSVLSAKLTAGTGSSVTVRDGDGTIVTATYSNVYDLYDNQWTTMDELIFILNNKLNITTNKISDNFLALTQSVTGNYYNYTIQSSSAGFITASGFDGGSTITYASTTKNIDGPTNRPEGWGLVFKDHPSQGDNDGAFGFIGADYGSSYPNPVKLKATRYREETAKRPINIKNIKTTSGSQKAGNYSSEIQIFSVAPAHQKTWAIEAVGDPNVQILPLEISQALPMTTHYQTLMGVATYDLGNIFGSHQNNRQPDGMVRVPATLGAFASGSFSVTGATVLGTKATGSFHVTGSPYAGTLASGSFDVTGTMVLGTKGVGSFTMTGAFAPAVSASSTFQVLGRTITGSVATGSFEVAGGFVASAPSTASFNVYAPPVGGNRSYAIFDAIYETATDGHKFLIRRDNDVYGVEVDVLGNGPSSVLDTEVSPHNFQKAIKITGSTGDGTGFHGETRFRSITANYDRFTVNMMIRIPDTTLNTNDVKPLWQVVDTTAGNDDPVVEIFFGKGSDRRNLYFRHYTETGSANYSEWVWGNFGELDYSVDGGEWCNLTFFRFGSTEIELYKNRSLYNTSHSADHSQVGSNNYQHLRPHHHYIMRYRNSETGSNFGWNQSGQYPEISDFALWGSSSGLATQPQRESFATEIYGQGWQGLTIPSSSVNMLRFTFGDHGDDGTAVRVDEIIYTDATTSENYNLTSSGFGGQVHDYVNSKWAQGKGHGQYFADLRTAIRNHNSGSDYFGVSYVEYTEVAKINVTSSWFSETNKLTLPGGNASMPNYPITASTVLHCARFFVTSSESSATGYMINPLLNTGSVTHSQMMSFKNLYSSGTGSAQVSAAATDIEDSTLTIDGAVFKFNNHGNDQTGNKIDTYSTTAFAISGSESSNLNFFSNVTYPATSGLNGGSDFSVSFWHARAAVDTQNDSILTLYATTGPAAGAVWIYTNSSHIYLKVYEDATQYKVFEKSFADIGINEEDLNHFVWTFDTSGMSATLIVNGTAQGSLTITNGGATAFSHTFGKIYVAGNPHGSGFSLEGRLDQVSIWDKILSTAECVEIYHDGRVKDLYGTSFASDLVHWYKLGNEAGLPGSGATLSSGGFSQYKDRTLRDVDTSNCSRADLNVAFGAEFTMARGLPADNIAKATFWNNLTASIESNVADYDVAYVNNTTHATFTVTNEVNGAAGNGDSLSEDSTLVYGLETTTGGGVNQAGTTDGAFITIKGKKFEADDDGSSSGGGTFYIQNTGSNTAFWNALSQSIKDNTDFDKIDLLGSGVTRIFAMTSSVRTTADNSAIDSVNGEFSIVSQTAGGVNDTGVVDGHYINLRPTSDGADARIFTVDVNNDGINGTPTNYKYIHSQTASSNNADWWNALSASLKSEGYDVSYVADSPSAGTASFTVTSYVAAAAGNNGSATIFSGGSFINGGAANFAGGLDASGSVAGHTVTVAGTTFTLIDTGSPSATQVLTTGSSVTSETMYESLRSKIATQTGYTVVTASSGIPRLFSVTSSVTGAAQNPSISRSGATFAVVNAGTAGKNESGVEAGDTITLKSTTFTMVPGAPTSSVGISLTGSSVAIRNALSSSIKANTNYDTISIVDLSNGYFRFNVTSSVPGEADNGTFSTGSAGVRDTFDNLVNAVGGTNPAGIEDTDRITIDSIVFHLTASTSLSDNSENKFIQTTGSSSDIWKTLKNKIEGSLPYNVVTSSTGNDAVFQLTASTTGSAKNVTVSEVGNSFSNHTNIAGGTDESGIQDADEIWIATSAGPYMRFHLTSSAPGSSTTSNSYIITTGSSSEIWDSLKNRINDIGQFNATYINNTNHALFHITASTTGSSFNKDFARMPNPGRSFAYVTTGAFGGVDYVAPIYGPDTVIMRPRTDLTGSERNISTRFSAPGGPEIQSYGYLDAYTSTYSVHNALPFRNLSVLGSGSGESTTMRVEDHLGLRRGLRTLRALHMGQFGIDSQYGSVTSTSYPTNGSFNKQHRNKSRVITDSDFDASLKFRSSLSASTGLLTSDTAYDSSSWPVANGVSFSFWVNPESETEPHKFFWVDQQTSRNNVGALLLGYDKTQEKIYLYSKRTTGNHKLWQWNYTKNLLNDGNWKHFYLNWDIDYGNLPTLVINGVTLSSPSAAGTASGKLGIRQPSILKIGDSEHHTHNFEGRMQNFLIYNSQSVSRAAALYNGGTPIISSLPDSGNIIDFWLLGNEPELESKRGDEIGTIIHPTTFLSVSGNNTSIGAATHYNTYIAKGINYVGTELIIEEKYDNAFINSSIPRSELQYSWIHAATTGSDGGGLKYDINHQKIVGYAPRDGILGEKDDFAEAIVFPTGSSIFND